MSARFGRKSLLWLVLALLLWLPGCAGFEAPSSWLEAPSRWLETTREWLRTPTDQPDGDIEGELRLVHEAGVAASALGGGVVIYLRSEHPGTPGSREGTQVLHEGRGFEPALSAFSAERPLELVNRSGVHHRIFWLEDGKRREVSLGPSDGTRASLAPDAPGIVRFYCDLHADEHFSAFSAPTPLFAVLDAPGPYSIESVPPGSWSLEVWSEQVEGKIRDVRVSPLRVSREDIRIDARKLVRQ